MRPGWEIRRRAFGGHSFKNSTFYGGNQMSANIVFLMKGRLSPSDSILENTGKRNGEWYGSERRGNVKLTATQQSLNRYALSYVNVNPPPAFSVNNPTFIPCR